MTSKILANGILRALAILLGIFLLSYFLYAIQSVIIYIIIAGILSLIARPIILFLRGKLKFPNTIAVVFTMDPMVLIMNGVRERMCIYQNLDIWYKNSGANVRW